MSLTLCYGHFRVLDLLLDLDLDCLALPLGCLMVLLPWGGLLLSQGPFCFDLQHVLKWFLFPHLWHFFAPCWAFSWWVRHAPFTACLTWATLGSVAITFPELECLDLIYGCCCCNSTVGFVSVEVFYCHLMLLGMLEEGLNMWCPLSSSSDLTHFLTSKCFVAWKSNSVLHTIFSASVWYWHLSTRSLMHWSNWSVDSCSPCLMSLYISLMWFQYDIDTSRCQW